MKHHSTLLFKEKNYFFMLLGDNPAVFDFSVFSFRRIHLAPTLVLLGFAVEIYAILIETKPKNTTNEKSK